MVSLRKFLHKEDGDAARFVAPLLEGIASTAIESEPEELTAFQQAIHSIVETVVQTSRVEATSDGIEQALRLLDSYNRRVHTIANANQNELRSMLALLMETLVFLSASSKTSVEQLSSIEKSLESVSTLNEIKQVQGRLAACLTLVRTESSRLKVQSEKRIKDLQAAILRASTQILPYMAASPPDPVTGLASSDAVRELISKSVTRGKSVTVALFVFEQIAELNRTVGRTVADSVLAASAEKLGIELAEAGPMLRWNGPAVVLVIEKMPDVFEAVQRRIKQLSKECLDCVVDVDQQPKRFRIIFSWTIESAGVTDSPEAVLRRLDDFVAVRTNGLIVH